MKLDKAMRHLLYLADVSSNEDEDCIYVILGHIIKLEDDRVRLSTLLDEQGDFTIHYGYDYQGYRYPLVIHSRDDIDDILIRIGSYYNKHTKKYRNELEGKKP